MLSPSIKWPVHFGCAASTRSLLAALLLAAATATSATAQSTNLSLYQDMAVECLGALPPQVERFVLDAADEMPYLRSALVEAWQADDREIYLTDASTGGAHVSYDVEAADVTYRREGRRLAREIRLTLHYTVANTEGRLLADDRCTRSRADVIPRSQVDFVQTETYPETQAALPRDGWYRRILEPAVLTAATVTAVYLFFTLRSAGGGDS